MKNVVLIGFMGVGKTEVGGLLASELGMAYIDTDSMIEAKQGRLINEIFAVDGEDKFRDMETAVLDELKGTEGHVISTGGGIILRPDNIKKLKSLGPVVLLRASPEVSYERLKGLSDRPLLKVDKPLDKIKEILSFREPIYRAVADIEVDTSKITQKETCRKIIECLKKAG